MIDTSKLKSRLKLKFLKQSTLASSTAQPNSKVLIVQSKETKAPQMIQDLIELDEIKDARASPVHSESSSSLCSLRAPEVARDGSLHQAVVPRQKL
jgi:hypothetical protein